ncbi:hypothetical protein COV58_00055 [Candidatus Roizmanbacteria bacterium CG11_big_fil_rev_8_21_14_0_20_36_8]|uniref:Uncharacterized protein n=1 Tax=Candidatus Roizmanbacteria bacterium CG11_big_fil_rev_8_21_14_0_20_36_8 TaxID=1974856 RepID=A0A2M6IVD8_9BACT|nr:MAG: hypothetical protein COV58_00055 [Candidatus Roizmanbacteria bacterium CG11_big_fil_rev_8_21_14_0_20_36_8]
MRRKMEVLEFLAQDIFAKVKKIMKKVQNDGYTDGTIQRMMNNPLTEYADRMRDQKKAFSSR